MGIPNNIRLDDLKQYSTDGNAHVNWTGPTAGIRNPYYVLNQRHNSDEPVSYTHLKEMYISMEKLISKSLKTVGVLSL